MTTVVITWPGTTANSANHFTSNIQRGTSETPTSAKVSPDPRHDAGQEPIDEIKNLPILPLQPVTVIRWALCTGGYVTE